ncbi:uncharacterized protein SCHCODRAFT_02666095 [Schizophyllum commune H4-8]|nr:uncharacterized protein SCHCODRAFT_02666095 [Schizophyllum commune H4-8]KAI5895826.1 hypothetical protein SCHCODRAFT_02666095 [Schizophyllum commune H4-8]
MSISPSVALESELVRLSGLMVSRTTSPRAKARLRHRIAELATQPGLFQFLERDPAEINAADWVPNSPTVLAVTACFLAITAVTTNLDPSEPSVSAFEVTQGYECAFAFWPRAFAWIPYMHPAYGTLPYHPVHHAPLINALHTMYYYGRCAGIFRERAATLFGYMASLWCFLVFHPKADAPCGEDTHHPSEVLASCVLDMLQAKPMPLPGYPEMSVLRSAVKAELVLVLRQDPRRIFAQLLRVTFTLLTRACATAPPDFEAVKIHISVIVLLARDVFTPMRHSRKSVMLAVDLVRSAPSSEVMEVVCDLVLAIWSAEPEDRTLRWALQCGIMHALKRDGAVGMAKQARAEALQYIFQRTTSRRVLRVLQQLGEAADLAAYEAFIHGVEGTIRRRTELLRKTCIQSRCAMKSRMDWKEHKLFCLWRWSGLLVDDHIVCGKSAADVGFVLLQTMDYISSQNGHSLLRELAYTAEEHADQGGELLVKVFLDRSPPEHVVVRKRVLGTSKETVLDLRVSAFLRVHRTITWQPYSLQQFVAAIQAVSTYRMTTDIDEYRSKVDEL